MVNRKARQPGERQWRVERLVSAGGVVYRVGGQGIEVVLCGRESDGVWGLPKGTPAPDEGLEQAAVREVVEETGLEVTIDEKIGVIEYWFARPGERMRYHKMVHHYLMSPIGGRLEDHDAEYDRVEWYLAAEAYRALTYANEANIVRKAIEMIEAKRPKE